MVGETRGWTLTGVSREYRLEEKEGGGKGEGGGEEVEEEEEEEGEVDYGMN